MILFKRKYAIEVDRRGPLFIILIIGGLMGKHKDYEEKTYELLNIIKQDIDFDIVDVEFEKVGPEYNLTIYCDMPDKGGIGIEDCATISRRMSDLLDENDFIKEAYTLCVSSPGLTRPFKKDKDYERYIGKDIEIKLYNNSDLPYIVGKLVEYKKDEVIIENEDGIITVEKKDIALARPYIEF